MSPEKAAKQAANSLMLAFKSIVPDNYTVGTGLFRRGPSEQSFHIKPESYDAISNAARKLLPLIDSYPLDNCIEHLTNYVIEEKDSNTPLPQVHERLREKVLEFLKGFASQGEWEILTAVRGVGFSECPFNLGPCSFYSMDETQFFLWGRRFATKRYCPPNDSHRSQNWLRLGASLRNQIVAVARIHATDQDHARAKGRSRIEEVLNVLRYSQLVIGLNDRTFPEVGLSGRNAWDDHNIVIRLDKPDCSSSMSGGSAGLQLSISRQAPGWVGLVKLVGHDLSARNELQLRLTTALEWIGQAALASSHPIRLVALVTALEALLIEESESAGKKTKLANRVSRLVANSDAEIPSLIKEFEELYKTRSECVHAGLLDIEKTELTKAVRIVARTVEAIFTRPSYCTANTLKDILACIDPPSTRSNVSRSQWVSENAYFRWLNFGRPENQHVQHWLDSEREYICTILLRGRRLDSFSADRQTEDEDEQAD